MSEREAAIAFHAGERDVKISLPCVECGKDSGAYAEDADGFICKACVEKFS